MNEELRKEISAGLWDLFRSCKQILIDESANKNLDALKNKVVKLMDLESKFAEEAMSIDDRDIR